MLGILWESCGSANRSIIKRNREATARDMAERGLSHGWRGSARGVWNLFPTLKAVAGDAARHPSVSGRKIGVCEV